MGSASITQREAGRLVRAYTARTMAEELGQMDRVDLVLEPRGARLEELSIVEVRNLLKAFEEEIAKLEHRAGEDTPAKTKTAPPATSAGAQP